MDRSVRALARRSPAGRVGRHARRRRARVLFYRGTRDPQLVAGARTPTRCTPADYDPTSADGRLYRSFGNYESDSIELYLARDRGIVREALGLTESPYFGTANVCRGAFMGRDPAAAERVRAAYLDE